jgi:hypothetical protein
MIAGCIGPCATKLLIVDLIIHLRTINGRKSRVHGEKGCNQPRLLD